MASRHALGRNRSQPSLQSKSLPRKTTTLANADATHDRLRTILLGKEAQQESNAAGGRRGPPQKVESGLPPVGEDLASDISPSGATHVGALTPAGAMASGAGLEGGSNTLAAAGSLAASAIQHESSKKHAVSYVEEGPRRREREEEKEAFMAQVCSDSTRLDVRDWISRLYEVLKKAKPDTEEDAQMKPSRRGRKAWSNSGASESTTITGTTGTALLAAGGSIAGKSATASRKAPSLISAESMVVHPGRKIEILSTEERLRAFLRNEIPELTKHVDAYLAKRAEEVRREIDEEVVEKHLLQMRRQEVFDGKINMLRWQNQRRIVLQKRLDTETPLWILEGVQLWDQKGAMKAREEEVSETDLIFDYLTKRAAHINSSKLAVEIPIFKTLHASYSLPSMWRDKYLEMH